MNEDDGLKQYRRIAAAEDLIESNALLELYVRLYKKKYRGEPLFHVNNVHLTQIKDFKKHAKEHAYGIMQHYFEMRDDWFIKQAYSLDCLIKNLHRVSADYTSRTTVHRQKGQVELEFFCDACWKPFNLICDLNYNFLNNPVRCPECKTLNAPLRRVNPADRRKTSIQVGQAFPDVPDEPLPGVSGDEEWCYEGDEQ